VWIGYLQWQHENGYRVELSPVLLPLNTIQQMDAILAYDEAGKPVEPAWPAAEVIVGNPPFLGGPHMRQELGGKYLDDLKLLYREKISGVFDLVCFWFVRTIDQIAGGKTYRAGLLSTNSIRFGDSRKALERIKTMGDIFMAWSDRPWILDGADLCEYPSLALTTVQSERVLYLDGRTSDKPVNADLSSIRRYHFRRSTA
jgi:hypothetical protein